MTQEKFDVVAMVPTSSMKRIADTIQALQVKYHLLEEAEMRRQRIRGEAHASSPK